MMKIALRLLIWIATIAYLMLAFGFIADKQENLLCESIRITILDSTINKFVQHSEILDLLLDGEEPLLGQKIPGIRKAETEERIRAHSFVRDAEVFSTVDGVLNVELTQRKPVMRIHNGRGEGYYIDSEGIIFPLSRHHTSRVILANGYIFEPFDWKKERNLNRLEVQFTSRNRIVYDLYELAGFIHQHPLWKSQFAQIYVNQNYEFELIPRVGAHVIYLGDISDYEEKFRKLEIFYKQGLNFTGWNQYHAINLKFKNQVVCTKR